MRGSEVPYRARSFSPPQSCGAFRSPPRGAARSEARSARTALLRGGQRYPLASADPVDATEQRALSSRQRTSPRTVATADGQPSAACTRGRRTAEFEAQQREQIGDSLRSHLQGFFGAVAVPRGRPEEPRSGACTPGSVSGAGPLPPVGKVAELEASSMSRWVWPTAVPAPPVTPHEPEEGSVSARFTEAGDPQPEWLLSDPRLEAAKLEGENRALRKAVEKARLENEELATRQAAAEARNAALEAENRAAAEALRRAVPLASMGVAAQPASQSGSLATGVAPQSLPPRILANSAKAPPVSSLRHELGEARGPSRSPRQLSPQAAEARDRMLGTSQEVGRRMEEIFARHTKLQSLLDADADATEAGSTAPSTTSGSA